MPQRLFLPSDLVRLILNSIHYQAIPDWPPSAWIATWGSNSTTVNVRHGLQVETHPNWFGEIVWDGDYSTGDFDKTDVVFGSGCRIRKNTANFVGSASPLDRLHSIQIDGTWHVSNSLVCLLAETDAQIQIGYPHYHRDFVQIIHGIDDSLPKLATNNGPLQLTYFRNLVWNKNQLKEVAKPFFQRERNTLENYQKFLEDKVVALAANSQSPHRKHQYGMIGTASTGFDSPTVAAIARAGGLKKVISISESRSGMDDCGDVIANQLGLEAVRVSRDGWKSDTLPEIPFLAADAKGEDVYFRAAGDELGGKLLFTGYCGSLWGGRSSTYLNFVRTDPSGLSHAEYRLWKGYIHIPLATLGTYQAKDLGALMLGPEVKKWSTGKGYDKPFCRSVLTAAGVDDQLYGQEKKAASVLIEDRRSFLTSDSLADFESFLNENSQLTIFSRANETFSSCIRGIAKTSQRMSAVAGTGTGLRLFERVANSTRLSEYANGHPRFKLLFPWAISHAIRRYLRHS